MRVKAVQQARKWHLIACWLFGGSFDASVERGNEKGKAGADEVFGEEG
jgi:hypothetical protein